MKDANSKPDTHEHWVSGDILEDVKFVIDLSCSNHVEDLKDNENIEYDSEMS